MATYTCPEDASSVSNLVKDPSTNLTELFSQCSGACQAAWVTNNPDISGIGVCISYAIQAALVLLFQFPFVVFYYYSPSGRRRTLVGLFEDFFKVYAVFNISFLVATLIIHVRPDGFVYGYELVFLLYILQFIAIGVCAVTATPLIIKLLEVLVVGSRPEEFRWQITRKKILIFGLVYALNFACALYQTFRPIRPTGFEAQYPQLAPFCPQFAAVAPPREWTNYIWLATSVVMLLSIVPVHTLHGRMRSGRSIAKRKVIVAWLVLLVVLGLAMSAMLSYLMHRVITVRRSLDQVIVISPDDDWGFGQLLALFIWVDPILKLGQKLAKFTWHRLGPLDVREKSRASRERMEQREELQNYMQQFPEYQPEVELVQRPPLAGGGGGGGGGDEKLGTTATWSTAQYTIVPQGGGSVYMEDPKRHPMTGSW